MADRATNLIKTIQAHGGAMPAADLAAHLGVSERSVRRYINRLNEELCGIAEIASDRMGGYTLTIYDKSGLDGYMGRTQSVAGVPTSPDERVRYLLNDLLNRADWVTLETLAGVLCVSRRTVSNDLKEVERRLSRFHLSLEGKPYRGIRIEGDEMDRRLCMANTVMQQVLDSQEDKADGVTIETVARCVERAVGTAGVAAVAYQNLLVHIAIAIVRIRGDKYVPMEFETLARIESSTAYVDAEKIASAIEETFEIELPKEEVAYIALHLAGKQTTLAPSDDAADAGTVVSDEVWNVVSDMLDVVWSTYRFDLRKDIELRMNLAKHIVPLSVRLRFHMSVENPILEDIRTRFPLAWSMAVDASQVLADEYGSMPDQDEIGYIALAFALALERTGNGVAKKNILVVCASGAGTARLLEHRCRQEFGAYIEHIETCDASRVSTIDFSRIDYVFTTVPLEEDIPVPVRQVGVFLDADDVSGIMEMLRAQRAPELIDYFPPELFFEHLEAPDKAAALGTMIDRTMEHFGLDDSFRSLVLERESVAPTAFGNMVALPHPVRSIGGRPFVTTGLLSHPIEWSGHMVEAVFLISFSDDPAVSPEQFNDGIAALLTNRQAISRLLEDRSYETLRSILESGPDA